MRRALANWLMFVAVTSANSLLQRLEKVTAIVRKKCTFLCQELGHSQAPHVHAQERLETCKEQCNITCH